MERYNPWWINEEDLGYIQWNESQIKWIPNVVNEISMEPFSLNFIFGPRQVGKTTAIKILIHKYLEFQDPRAIFYYSCDELTDYRELSEVLDNY
ncbi:MAG: AAA family ATPase, partial [Thermoplasmata archaeon]